MKSRVIAVLFVLLIFHSAIGQPKPIVASDLMKIVTTAQLQISPDGKKAVTVVIRKAVRNESEYYYTRHLYLLDLEGDGESVQLTFGDRNDSQPQWSPDGSQIAFVRADGERSQIWILPMQGGEARAVTKAEFGANRPRWSPDGKTLMYTSRIPHYAIEGTYPWPVERPGRKQGDEPNFKSLRGDDRKKVSASPDGDLDEIRSWLARNASEQNPRVFNRLNLQGELNLQPDEDFAHVFMKSINADEKAIQLTSGFQDFENAEWSSDGTKIICDSKKYVTHPDREQSSDLWLIDVKTKEAREFFKLAGYSLTSPKYSPDGQKVLFMANSTTGRLYAQNEIGIVSAEAKDLRLLTEKLDYEVGSPAWSQDSKSVYYTVQALGYIPVYQANLATGAAAELLGGTGGVNDFDVAGDQLVYAFTETRNPWEVYRYNLKSKRQAVISRLNEVWVKDRVISVPREAWNLRPDGTRIQYWVMEPAGRKEGKRYPALLNIHGGPSVMWGPGVFSMWHEFQLECSWGYGVVYSNPRGSGGYGDAFKRANMKDWGTTPSGDILTSLDEAIKHNSWIDPANLVVEGGSYAGYMVAWIISHDHRFKAANAQRGVYDLTTFMGEGNAWRLVPEHFGGYPWEKETRQLLDANSPYSFVSEIRTPLLIIHGDQDLRTGYVQSEMLYKSLKILNKPVEYIRYPKEGHELTRSGNPGRMMDHLLRTIEFFERYVTHQEPPPATQK
ncbi:MAG: S9 family peptidase [Cyclobacteriaceae bacterium]|nr:S9 family peptidase [Cyclobacteriaceae bacterium]